MTAAPPPNPRLLDLTARAFALYRPRKRRTMREFAEQEIILPDGPFEGHRFTCDRQPFTALFFEAVEDPYWSQFVLIGPRQASKTLIGFVIPICYYLFECGEDVILAAPTQDIAGSKWLKVLRPIIERSRYADLLPDKGAASESGASNLRSIRFLNGAWLFLKSAGGGKGKAKGLEGDTARVIAVTEVEGFAGTKTSRRRGQTDPDPLGKLRKSVSAYTRHGRPLIFMECTTTTEDGITWSAYTRGSESRIAIPCPHCGSHVTPEREHFVGWSGAPDVLTARDKGSVVCPDCGATWTEQERVRANATPLLLHRGQKAKLETPSSNAKPEIIIVGDRPRTNVLGFRWNAVNNLFTTSAEIAQEEWNAAHAGAVGGTGATGGGLDAGERADMELLQYVWARPWKPDPGELVELTAQDVMARAESTLPRGFVPAGTLFLTAGVDVGKHFLRWVVLASLAGATPHVVDYGVVEVNSRGMDEPHAILLALCELRDRIMQAGFMTEGADQQGAAKRRSPTITLVDSGYQGETGKEEPVYKFCEESRGYFAAKGFGTTQKYFGKTFKRRATGDGVVIMDEYQIVARPDGRAGQKLVENNADYWKGRVRDALLVPRGSPGAMTLFGPEPHEPQCHMSFAKHLIAEKPVEEFIAGRGLVKRWFAVSKINHYLDATYMALVAAHAAGARLMASEVPAAAPPPKPREPDRDRDERSGWMGERPSGWV